MLVARSGLLLALLVGACSRKDQRENIAPASLVAPVANASAEEQAPPQKDPVFALNLEGQLDRIDHHILTPGLEHFRPWGEVSQKVLSIAKLDEAELRRRSKWKRTDMNPSAAMALAADSSAHYMRDNVGERQIRKNRERYAGRPFRLINAKILRIIEANGETRAEVIPSGWQDHLAVAMRSETDFVDGDRVDIVGFLTSDVIPESDIGLMAGAAFLKASDVDAMDRVTHIFVARSSGD